MVHKYAAKDVKSSNYLKLQSQHPWWLFKLATLVCITSVWLSEFGAAIYGHFHTLIVSYPDCVQQGFFSFSFFKGGNWVDSENRLFPVMGTQVIAIQNLLTCISLAKLFDQQNRKTNILTTSSIS